MGDNFNFLSIVTNEFWLGSSNSAAVTREKKYVGDSQIVG